MKTKILLLGLILIINSIFVLADDYNPPTFDGILFAIGNEYYPEDVEPVVYTNQRVFAYPINPSTDTGGQLDWVYKNWYVNDEPLGSHHLFLDIIHYKKHDTVKVEMQIYDRISKLYSETKTRSVTISNSKPVITSISANQPSADDNIIFTVHVQDNDNDNLRIKYKFTNGYTTDLQYMECSNGKCTIIVPSSETEDGETIKLTAIPNDYETNGNIKYKSVTVNGAPVIDSFSPDSTINKDVGDSQTFTVNAHDPESQTLTYKWYADNNLINGATTKSYTYTVASGTQHFVKVIVSDNVNLVSKQWTVNVNPNPKPIASIDLPTGNIQINVNNAINFQGSGNDDGTIAAYSWNFGDASISTEQNPSYTYTTAGTFTVRFKVQDNNNQWSDEVTRTITVVIPPGPNNSPLIDSYSPTDTTPRILLTETQEFSITASDIDNDQLTKTWYVDNSQVTTGDSYTYNPTTTGNYEIKVVVSDGSLTAQRTWTLRVRASEYDGILMMEDLDVKVDDKTDTNVNDAAIISKDAHPGSKLQLKFKIKNDGELEIEDISIIATLRAIDDGEDIEEESDDFDLKAGKNSAKKTITLDIPYKVDERTYNLDIHIEGDDEDHNVYEIDWTLKLHVEKERHELIIYKTDLGSETLECVRYTNLNVEVLNIGQEDEDDIKLEVLSPGLGIDFVKKGIDLTDDPFDEDSSYKKSIRINAEDKEGTYSIVVNVYREDKLEDTKTLTLTVGECKVKLEEKEKDFEVTKIPMRVIEEVEEEDAMIIPLIVGIVVVLVLIIVSLYFGFRKR